MKKKWKKNSYLKISIYAFCTVAACILFYQLSRDFSFIGVFLNYVTLILGPVLYGGIIAYFLSPLLNFYELTVFAKTAWRKETRRTISLISSYISALVIIGVLVVLIAPQLVSSLNTLVSNVATYTENVQAFVDGLFEKVHSISQSHPKFTEQLDALISGAKDSVLGAFSSLVQAFPGVVTFLTQFSTELTNIIVGIVISVYLLGSKERFAAQCKKALCAFFKKKTVARIVDFTHDIHESVGGFILAKILDGAIVGVLSFIVFSIFGIPFAMLLSVILAVCNIIPFFGQIIGPIIGALILLVIAPTQVLWFILMCFVIMQVDGNLIGPRLIGKRIGISSFWIIVSLLAGGRMFGFWGMFLGAPVFAVLYGVIKRRLEARLEERSCSPRTKDYFDYLHEEPSGIIRIAFRKKKDFSAPVLVEEPPKAKKSEKHSLNQIEFTGEKEKKEDFEDEMKEDDDDDASDQTPK